MAAGEGGDVSGDGGEGRTGEEDYCGPWYEKGGWTGARCDRGLPVWEGEGTGEEVADREEEEGTGGEVADREEGTGEEVAERDGG